MPYTYLSAEELYKKLKQSLEREVQNGTIANFTQQRQN